MFPFDLNLSGKQKLKLLHKSFSVLSSERGFGQGGGGGGKEWCPAGHARAHPDGYIYIYSVLIVRKYFIPVVVRLRRTQNPFDFPSPIWWLLCTVWYEW